MMASSNYVLDDQSINIYDPLLQLQAVQRQCATLDLSVMMPVAALVPSINSRRAAKSSIKNASNSAAAGGGNGTDIKRRRSFESLAGLNMAAAATEKPGTISYGVNSSARRNARTPNGRQA
jgi:hypothetical protein